MTALLVMEAALPGATLLALDGALRSASDGVPAEVLPHVAGLFGLALVAAVAKLSRTALSKQVAWRLADGLRRAAHRRLLEGVDDQRTVGDRLALLGQELDEVQLGVSAAVTLLRDPVALFGLGAAAVWIAPGLALVTLAVLLPMAALVWGSTRWVARAAAHHREARAHLLGLAGEQLLGREVVVAHDAVEGEGVRFAVASRRDRSARWWLDVVRGVPGALTQVLGVAALGGVLLLASGPLGGGLDGPAVLAFAAGLFLALRPLTALAEASSLLRRAQAALARAEALLHAAPPVWKVAPERPGAEAVVLLDGAQQDESVGPVSLAVPAGQLVVLMGPTGSGKTTVLRWLAGLQPPTCGAVRVGGARPHAVDPAERLAAWVPQDSSLFARTIADNARLGRPHAGDHAVHQALQLAEASGLDPDARLAPAGAPLSGGERQRLAVARSLLLDRPLWLLDEPTAHLDEATRDRLVASLARSRGRRTVVIASHDPAVARLADRVVLLQGGRVVADGPPGRVLARRAEA